MDLCQPRGPSTVIIAGPTACGKSDLAVRLAHDFSGEILSCDSIQVYRHMDIGSAKLPPVERRSIPHHGLDLCMPSQPFNIKEFASYAAKIAEEVHRRGKPLFVVGGTGFYLKLFYGPVIDDIEIDQSTIENVNSIFEKYGTTGLMESLKKYNKGICPIDNKNDRRLRRYLERCMVTGKSIDEQKLDLLAKKNHFGSFRKLTFILFASSEFSTSKIARRTDAMIRQGLVDEVRFLRSLDFEKNYSASHAIGYREVLSYLDGQLNLTDLENEINNNTKKLVKKQKTWFRTQISADRTVDAAAIDYESIRDAVSHFLKNDL